MKTYLLLLPLLFLSASCDAMRALFAPQITSSEQRELALAEIDSVVAALQLLYVTEVIEDEERYQLALKTAADIRQRIVDSATKPVSWVVIFAEIAALAKQWAVVL